MFWVRTTERDESDKGGRVPRDGLCEHTGLASHDGDEAAAGLGLLLLLLGGDMDVGLLSFLELHHCCWKTNPTKNHARTSPLWSGRPNHQGYTQTVECGAPRQNLELGLVPCEGADRPKICLKLLGLKLLTSCCPDAEKNDLASSAAATAGAGREPAIVPSFFVAGTLVTADNSTCHC
jgi:hypothetical protein